MKVSRRIFLKSGGVAMIGMSTIPAFLQRAVAATPMPNKKKLIVLFQRGAADGLNIVVPFGEENYYRIRPTIAIPQPRQRRRRRGGRSRRILRPASEPRAARPAISQRATCHRSRGRFAGHDALAFRRAGFHGVRHARRESHRRRLAESHRAGMSEENAFAVPRRGHGAESSAHAARRRAGDRACRREAISRDEPIHRGRGRFRSALRADGGQCSARHGHGNL